MKKQKAKSACRQCGKPGKYYYSRRLSLILELSPWEGVFLCDECYITLCEQHGRV
jgi:hypothetical protein